MSELASNKNINELQICIPKFLKNDMWVYSIGALTLVLIGLYLFLEYSGYGFVRRSTGAFVGKDANRMYGPAILALLPVLVGILFWRFKRLKAFLNVCNFVTGTITKVRALDYGSDKITVEYEYDGIQYKHRKMIVFGKKSLLKEGNSVVLLVNAASPKKALIKELFFAD